MASIYARGNVLWCRVKDGGRWVRMPTPYRLGDEAKARRFAEWAQEALLAKHAGVVIGPLTVMIGSAALPEHARSAGG